MGLFGKGLGGFVGGIAGGGIAGGGIFDKGPSISDKVDMIFKDVETEGKIQGYERASKEYGKVFKLIENEYKETKRLIEKQKIDYDIRSEDLIVKLETLEKQKFELQNEVNRKTQELSSKYNIPKSDVSKSLASGTLLMGGPATFDVLDLVYSYKERKLKEAEQRGYIEAKELYEEKIARLKKDLYELKAKGTKEIQELLDMINELFDAISKEQMKIAELSILL